MVKQLLLVPLLAIFLFAGAVQAQTPNSVNPADLTTGQANDLPDPGMLPGNPFYFLKSWSEDIGTFFTFGDVAKAERFLNLSEKRLAEANALANKGKSEIAEKAIGRYQEQLSRALAKAEEAKAKGLDTDEVLAKVSEATLKHQAVLADVYERVPEQAKPAIERAMQVGMRGHEEALKAVSGEKREEVMRDVEEKRQEVEQKLEDLRNKGVPVPTIPTREEIEQKIPARPETGKPETPGQPQTQEQESEIEKPETPEVETELPDGAGKPQTPGRP
ncbi:MAG: hypothetical protein FJ044_00845 [Candidatus Cloacimonetes bacterium]|nr:hypothetical protein [Candidatus Cloacimonadota bacterium]